MVLGLFLMAQYKEQVVVPDFGFYARPFHSSLIRENRLIAGVYTLSELDEKMRQLCLLMPKVGRQCTPRCWHSTLASCPAPSHTLNMLRLLLA
jgi:hypothetical protein